LDKKTRIIYGANPVLEAIRAKRVIHHLYLLKGKEKLQQRIDNVSRGIENVPGTEVVTPSRMQQIIPPGATHQGIAAEVEVIPNSSLTGTIKDKGKDMLVLLFDGVEDPGNLGAVYRVADAAGVDIVFIPAKGSASHQLASVAKASAGAVEHVKTVVVSRLNNVIEELKGHGFKVVALEVTKDAKFPDDLDLIKPVALVIGSEGRGISHSIMQMVDCVMKLPMSGRVNSLNVATATAVGVFEIVRANKG
jgi:23S rRNA (guanosine2251-2'-O)-methyltransferase